MNAGNTQTTNNAVTLAMNTDKYIGEGSPHKESKEAWIISHLPQFDPRTSKKD